MDVDVVVVRGDVDEALSVCPHANEVGSCAQSVRHSLFDLFAARQHRNLPAAGRLLAHGGARVAPAVAVISHRHAVRHHHTVVDAVVDMIRRRGLLGLLAKLCAANVIHPYGGDVCSPKVTTVDSAEKVPIAVGRGHLPDGEQGSRLHLRVPWNHLDVLCSEIHVQGIDHQERSGPLHEGAIFSSPENAARGCELHVVLHIDARPGLGHGLLLKQVLEVGEMKGRAAHTRSEQDEDNLWPRHIFMVATVAETRTFNRDRLLEAFHTHKHKLTASVY